MTPKYSRSQRAFAECFGTAALVLVGSGSVIATLTPAGKTVPAVTEPDQLGIAFAFGLIIMALVYAIGKVSGCHINPARAFGPELVEAIAGGGAFWAQYIPVYLVPGLVGAAGVAFLYDFMANPRLVEEPVIEAVSHEDPITADSRQQP